MSSELIQVCIQVYLKANSFIIFIYSEKATNVCENFTVDLSYVVLVKSTVEILQNFVAFSEYMNFKDVTTLSVLQGFCWAIITIIGTFKSKFIHKAGTTWECKFCKVDFVDQYLCIFNSKLIHKM